MAKENKEFWDVEESKGFVKIKSPIDDLEYKVWDSGTEREKLEVANNLARVRRDMNTLLIYLAKNPQLWIDKPIAYGIILTFDIHIPCIYSFLDSLSTDNIKNLNNKIIRKCVEDGTLFNYQEMTPNNDGIIGLNKPKIIKTVVLQIDGKEIKYEIAEKRSIFLTIRNRYGKINNYSKILDLATHEITHTTCNDVRWKPDNHKPPYPYYHKLMRKWVEESGITS